MAVNEDITYLSSVLVLLAQVVLSAAVLATVTQAQVPVGDWTFDDGSGTKAVDSSGNGNTATLVNGINWVTGKVSGAVSANGVNQFVSIPPIDLSGTNAVTVALWSNRTYSTGGGHVLVEATTNFNYSTSGFVFLPDDNTCQGIQAGLRGDVGYTSNCYSQPSSGVWHHLAIVFDKGQTGGNQVAFYVDGVLQAPNRNLAASTNTNNFGNNPLYLFARGGSSYFDLGFVDDFRIYDTALTAAQIQQIYTSSGTWGQGFDFRNTSTFVTDPPGDTYVLPSTTYPTTINGVTFGWTTSSLVRGRDRSTSVDPRLAGKDYPNNGSPATFYVDLPSAGTYSVALAMGDEGYPQCSNQCQVQFLDGSTVLATVTGGPTNQGYFYDAEGNNWSAAAWPTSNVSQQVTLTGTRLTMVVGTNVTNDRTPIAFLGVTQVSASPNFTVSASPAPLSVAQGNQGTTTITTAVSGGFNSSISLSASGAPTGTTLSVNPGTIAAPGAGNSTMTMTVGSSTPVGTYPITVTGNGGGTQQNATVSLTVTAPVLVLVSVAVTPVSPSIAAGTQQQFTATGTYSDGSHKDLTSSATWTSSAPSVATISSGGLATALVAGSTTIQAASGSINGSAGLTVTTQITNTIWAPSTTPTVVDSGDGNSVELGVKFRADSDGHITGLRFYKASANVGTHIGNIWTSSGTLLGTATFTNETASDWQQVSFNNPIPVTANTTYIASYFAPVGHYSEDDGYFGSSGVDNPPLHALANGVDGANGVYIYNPSSAFPSNGYLSSNYWVDVVYTTAASYSLSGKISGTGGAGATVTLSGTRNVTTTADGSGNYSFAGLGNGSYTLTPSNSGVTFTPPSRTVTVNGTSLSGVNFTATNPLDISGTISGAGGAGATVTLSGAGNATTAADGSGNYAFYQLVNGTYSVTPSLTGYIYTPGTQTVTLNGSSGTGVNFTSQTATYSSVVLSWTASTSPVVGYNAYRSTISGGQYTKLNSSLIATTSYTDQTVQSGSTYYYVATAVDSQGNESSYSNQAVATVP